MSTLSLLSDETTLDGGPSHKGNTVKLFFLTPRIKGRKRLAISLWHTSIFTSGIG